jgi:hypothetical protein
MLPTITDNDTVCWAPGCGLEVAPHTSTGLCSIHRNRIRAWQESGAEPDARLWTLLDMRLNVLQESRGACVSAPGPCDMEICRYHLADGRGQRATEGDETCAIRIANRGGVTLEEIALQTGCVRERIRQLEDKGLRNLKRACERDGIALADVVGIRRRRTAA